MPEPLIPSTLVVVTLGLLSSVGWGIADFGGGLASRKAPVLGVLGGSQVASLLIAGPLLLARGEPAMRDTDYVIAALGGAIGAIGLALLYRGLAVGRMGVVAPVAAVLTAALPVAFGFLTQGVPSALAIVGIVAAVASVVLVSRAPVVEDGRQSGLRYGLAAGAIFGLFTITAAQLSDDVVFGPTIVIRITSVTLIAGWILVRRRPWRVERRLWPILLVIGVIDMLSTVTYLSAIAIGPLAIAAILASLYPVVTTILAALVLRERVTPIHAAGILSAGLAVVLIAGATAT